MTFLVKLIKPGKMDLKQLEADLFAVMEAEGKRCVTDFQRTTRTWRNKPPFAHLVVMRGMKDAVVRAGLTSWVHGSAIVGKNAEVWGMLNVGTRPHPIRPRRAKLLRFRTGYKAKTTPRQMTSRAGGTYGDVVFSRGVMHPGTDAREWTETEYNRRIGPFRKNVAKAIRATGLYRR